MRSSPGSFHHEYECCVSTALHSSAGVCVHCMQHHGQRRFPWEDGFPDLFIIQSVLDMCVMVLLTPHCRLSSVWENYIKIWMGGNGLTNTLPQFPIGRLAFSQTDAQAAGWRTRGPTHTHTRTHTHKSRAHALKGKQTGRVCLQFLSTVWHLSTLVSGWQSL